MSSFLGVGFFNFYVFSLLGFFFVFFWGGVVVEFCLFSLAGCDIVLSFTFDYLSLGFFSCVSLISSMVFFFSSFYMSGDLTVRRFYYLVFLFVVSMFFLVFSGSFFVTMVGWDGLGLVSFCLVIYYQNSSSLDSGLLTVFTNRVGDVFFILSFFYFLLGGNWGPDLFFFGFPVWFLFFVFFGAITKSAQVPFSAWLPAAMAAPTPVSSLVHSSTLVTAGVYVIIRYHYLFGLFSWFFKLFSIFTMFLAGICALVEKDFKKIIAMSTLSQLGMMLFVLFCGCWNLAFLHMITHAFFKSMLFLSGGSLIYQLSGSQDSRFYGCFFWNSGSFLYFFVSCISLSGFPFVVGFYSKDSILSYSCSYGGIGLFVFFFCCLLTVLYSVRLLVNGFVFHYGSSSQLSFFESFWFLVPVYVLFLVCCFSGGLISWFVLSGVTLFFRGFDFFVGLLILLICFFFYRLFPLHYFLISYFSLVGFLRWLTAGQMSGFFPLMSGYREEYGWIEVLGGRGFYGFVLSLSEKTSLYFDFGIKGLLIFLLFVGFLFI